MAELLSVADLEAAKKQDTFHSEVITGKAGGIATGADIDYATNTVTGQVQATLPKIISQVGFAPASFDFITGGTLSIADRNKAIFYETDGNWYSWGGALPKTIATASSPNTTGGIAVDAWNVSTSAFMYRDWRGFSEALYAEAGITDNGLPDTAIASQRLDAMKKVFLPNNEGVIFAKDLISDYENPTIAEITHLMECGATVMWGAGVINLLNTISFAGNTIWVAASGYDVWFKSQFMGYMLNTVGNTGTCGTIGINFDCNYMSEHAVQYSTCNIVKAFSGTAKNVRVQTASNFRGGWFFLQCTQAEYDALQVENVQQKAPLAGSFQAYSFIDVERIIGGTCYGKTIDKLFNASGVCSGDAGMFIGKDCLDNALYVLGAPKALVVNVIADNCKQGIVYDAQGASSESSLRIPYARFNNVTSRIVVPRQGNGLHIGTLISNDSHSGISDVGYVGATNTIIDNAYLTGVTNGRPLDYANGDIAIGNLVVRDTTSSDFGEVCRFEDKAVVDISRLDDAGGSAATCVRVQTLSTGSVTIRSIETPKVPLAFLASVDFGGKVFTPLINGFDIIGNVPSPKTISGGVLTINNSYHRVDTEGGAASDEIDTISGAPSIGTMVTLQSTSNLRDIILKHNTGNLYLPSGADIRLNALYEHVTLRWGGTYWSVPL